MRSFRPSLSALLLAMAFALALRPTANNDLWWHLETGRWMAEHHRLPVDDPFSFTGFMSPWHDAAWLSELSMFGIWTIAGEAGLIVGAALVLALVFGLVRSLARLTTESDLVATGLMLVGIVMSRYGWSPRPALASVACALLTLVILEHFRRGGARRVIWALPFIAALWANLDGGFVLAPVLVGTVALAAWLASVLPALTPEGFTPRTRNRLVVIALIVPVALLFNANGTSALTQSAETFGAIRYRYLLDGWTWPDLRFVLAAWSVTAAIVLGSSRPRRLSTVALGLALTALSTSAHRFELYYGLLVLPVLGEYLIERTSLSVAILLAAAPLALIPGMPIYVTPIVAVSSFFTDRVGSIRTRPAPAWPSMKLPAFQAVALIALVALAVIGVRRDHLRMKLDHYPVAAIETLEAAHAKRVFNLYSWGGWLLWTTDLPTFIDGRSWGGGNVSDYIEAHAGRYVDVFNRYDVRWTLLPPDAMASRLLAGDPAWEQVYADGTAVVFRRR
jgi:hypothetical protein